MCQSVRQERESERVRDSEYGRIQEYHAMKFISTVSITLRTFIILHYNNPFSYNFGNQTPPPNAAFVFGGGSVVVGVGVHALTSSSSTTSSNNNRGTSITMSSSSNSGGGGNAGSSSFGGLFGSVNRRRSNHHTSSRDRSTITSTSTNAARTNTYNNGSYDDGGGGGGRSGDEVLQTSSSSYYLRVRDDEPYLYNIPNHLSMSYKPVPILTKSMIYIVSIYFISILMSLISTSTGAAGSGSGGGGIVMSIRNVLRNAFIRYPIEFLQEMVQTKNVKTIVRWIVSTLLFGIFITKCIQEYNFGPSRIIQHVVTTTTAARTTGTAAAATTTDDNNETQEEEEEVQEQQQQQLNSCTVILPSSLSNYDILSLSLPPTNNGGVSSDNVVQVDEEVCMPGDYQLHEEGEGVGGAHQQRQFLGVHYLKYPRDSNDNSNNNININNATGDSSGYEFQAMYMNHGFGASSLSWLPALPKLTDTLRAKFGIGHDAVGFGFTERPSSDSNDDDKSYYYTPLGSASIGISLLRKYCLFSSSTATSTGGGSPAATTEPTSVINTNDPIILFGHSMGSIATLHMALQLPRDVPKLIILCAPALGLRDSMVLQQRRKRQREEERRQQREELSRDTTTNSSELGRRSGERRGSGGNGDTTTNVVPPRYATTSRSPITAMFRSYVEILTSPIVKVISMMKCSNIAGAIVRCMLIVVTKIQQFLIRRLLDPIVIYFLRRLVG